MEATPGRGSVCLSGGPDPARLITVVKRKGIETSYRFRRFGVYQMELNMSKKKMHWALLALVTFIALLFILPPVPKSKARPQRLQTVNHLWSASITLPRTNALPTAAPNK